MRKIVSVVLMLALVFSTITVSALNLDTNKAYASGTKITITPSMVTNESGFGNATELVDEQALAGDPANGTGGAPTTAWFGGWSGVTYPMYAYIDLGQAYNLTNIYVYDTYSTGDWSAYAGSPGNWSAALFTDPLTSYMTWNSHPVSVTTRYIRVGLATGGANAAEMVVYGTPASPGGGDITPPAAVTNLAAPSSTANSVNLTWTAPGDDNNTGTAASYDFRYSTAAITNANWASASQAVGEPAPLAAGTSQTFTVSGLSPGTTYYFALKTADAASNISGLSNVVSKATTPAAGGGKITLTASMILNESAVGDATKLVDEQAAAGNPKGGTGGVPTTIWDTGWNSIYYPASVVIDLGADYALSDIYFYDSDWGGSGVTVSSGTPFNWTNRFTDNLSNSPGNWVGHAVNFTTRYLQLKITECCLNASEIVLYGTPLGTPAAPPTPVASTLPTMDKLIGINAFIDDPLDKMQVAGFVREYHNWNWDEGDLWNWGAIQTGYTPGNNKFNPSYAGGGWNFDAYYTGLKNAGITVSPAIQGSVGWLSAQSDDKPISAGEDPLAPASYSEHADHLYQYAARYGGTAVADSKLKLASGQPRSTGLNVLKYYENGNETDKWWAGRMPYFNPYEYAAMTSADYDGHQGAMGNTYGVKNADPDAKLVMSGLADPNLEYIRALKFWADWNRAGSIPFDAINIHHYSNNGTSQTDGTIGISPEADDLKGRLKKFVDYRNQYMQGKEVWITEFGYDTNAASIQRAPAIGTTSAEEVQGQWLVRSYLAAAAAGVDKAAMYMLRDVDGADGGRFASSGLTGSMSTNWAPKISWYYVYTLKNRLAGMRYSGEAASGNANVRIYKFKNATGSGGAYVVWAPTSNNTTVNNYQLALSGAPTSATKVTLATGNTNGASSTLAISSGKVTVNVSERPQFVLVNDIQ